MMGALDKFLSNLVNYDKENIHQDIIKELVHKYVNDPEFDPDFVAAKSSAAAGKISSVFQGGYLVLWQEGWCREETTGWLGVQGVWNTVQVHREYGGPPPENWKRLFFTLIFPKSSVLVWKSY